MHGGFLALFGIEVEEGFYVDAAGVGVVPVLFEHVEGDGFGGFGGEGVVGHLPGGGLEPGLGLQLGGDLCEEGGNFGLGGRHSAGLTRGGAAGKGFGLRNLVRGGTIEPSRQWAPGE